MKNLIETLKSSKNIFLKAEGASIEKWKNLPHTKEGLELFLKFNIAEIQYGVDKYFCTASVELINRALDILGIKKTLTDESLSSKRNLVMCWDLDKDKIISFSMKNRWEILNLIEITPQNIEIINSAMKEVLNPNPRKNALEKK